MQKNQRTQTLVQTLTPEAALVISEMLEAAYGIGMNIQIHSAYRSPAEQDGIYAQGRTKPGKIATNAKGSPIPQSTHCYKVAVDCHFDNNEDGVAEWNPEFYQKVWTACVAKGLDKKGLRWAGNWENFKESAHFEVSHGKTWQEMAAAAGYKVAIPAAKPVAEVKPAGKKK